MLCAACCSFQHVEGLLAVHCLCSFLGRGGSKRQPEFCNLTIFYKDSVACVTKIILFEKLFGFVKKVSPLRSYLP